MMIVSENDILKLLPFKRDNGASCGHVIVTECLFFEDIREFKYGIASKPCKKDGTVYKNESLFIKSDSVLYNISTG